MKSVENAVAEHYGDESLLMRILDGLKDKGLDVKHLTTDDLAPFDEFHIGGREATKHVMAQLQLNRNDHVLDIGCGIGGAARTVATLAQTQVTGIDLTPEFIDTARVLTDMTGLSDRISFQVSSALDLPFEAETFDAAITLHAAMNIPDRPALYAEIARVLKSGAPLCIYDVMRLCEGEIAFPVPWADTPATSHLTTPDEMRDLLNTAGFTVSGVEERRQFAIDFFRQIMPSGGGKNSSSIPLPQRGAAMAEKFKNVQINIEKGFLSPVQMMVRKN